jgi:hypothetical protein
VSASTLTILAVKINQTPSPAYSQALYCGDLQRRVWKPDATTASSPLPILNVFQNTPAVVSVVFLAIAVISATSLRGL